ncbi:MAG: hypothetical protein RLZZ600_1339, partial [Actinomycetota bacterium]
REDLRPFFTDFVDALRAAAKGITSAGLKGHHGVGL